jgi:sarcosine oxidase/L-pipecolate oxidase
MNEYRRLGGKFIGDSKGGYVVENLIEAGGAAKRVIGVRTADGKAHYADQVIYAIGSWTTFNRKLVPGLDTQIQPIGFAIAHWQLTPEEVKAWQDHPVVDMYHYGYFFPPDPKTHLMKLGLGIVGFTHDHPAGQGDRTVGIARANSGLVGSPDEGRIPALAEKGIRWVLSRWAPSLAKKKFFDMKVCWDAMTPDGGWLIDHHPEIQGLSVATGGSGHGFKFLPVVGQYICEALDVVTEKAVGCYTSESSEKKKSEMRQKWAWGRKANLNVKDRRVVLQGRPVLDIVEQLNAEKPQEIEGFIRSRL